MKKSVLLAAVAAMILIQTNTHAQGLYFGIGGGYGMGSGVQDNSYHTNNTHTSSSYSLGSGGDIGIYAGYMVNKNIGFELGIGDKLSSSTTTTSSDTGMFAGSDKYTYTAGMLRFTPAIRLQFGDGNLKVYSVTGLVIGMPMGVTSEDAFTPNSNLNQPSDEVWTISGGTTIGFHGAIGVLYMITDKIGIFGELTGYFQNWSPGKSVVTTYTQGGVNELSNMKTYQIETDYVSSYTQSASPSPNSPSQSTNVYLPFSSFGLNVGVHFSLASK